MLKTQLKKEQLETEIEILENKAKIKRQELRNSIVSPTRHLSNNSAATPALEYDYIPNRLSSADHIRHHSPVKQPIPNQNTNAKPGINYEDVIIIKKIQSHRRVLTAQSAYKLFYDEILI